MNAIAYPSVRESFEWLERFLDSHQIELEDSLEVSLSIREAAMANQVALTPGAILMLIVPIAEAINSEEETRGSVQVPDKETIRSSIAAIVDEASRSPSQADKDYSEAIEQHYVTGATNRRSAFSVIRAFFARYCRIPPFCSKENTP